MRKRRVEVIQKSGSTAHEWIEPWNIKSIWSDFRHNGIYLPNYKLITHKDDLRILLKSFEFTFREYHRDGSITLWKYIFKPGFIWDLASVPKRLRGLVDNDSRTLRAAAMVHDVDYALHICGYRRANKKFYRIIRAHEGVSLQSVSAYVAVAIAGKHFYDLNNPNTHWMKDFVEVYKDGNRIDINI